MQLVCMSHFVRCHNFEFAVTCRVASGELDSPTAAPPSQPAAEKAAPDSSKAGIEKTDKLAMTSDGPKLAS